MIDAVATMPPEAVGWDALSRAVWLFDPVSCRGLYANPSALELWGAQSRDDIQMPVMDGVEAARTIRALGGAGASTPIVALTANTLDSQVRSYLEAGMQDCIAKPVMMPELLAKTAAWGARGRES